MTIIAIIASLLHRTIIVLSLFYHEERGETVIVINPIRNTSCILNILIKVDVECRLIYVLPSPI
jgi:hypothetical protein